MFLKDPGSFAEARQVKLEDVQALPDLCQYLEGVTLDSLFNELRYRGITQKELAESIGMSTRHLSAVKASELRNRSFHELSATKLACLWVLERFTQSEE